MPPDPPVPDDRVMRRAHRRPGVLDQLILALLRGARTPISAHDLARLGRASGSTLSVAQVYRVLDRLMRQGAVQRIELLSAYAPAGDGHRGFIICRLCRTYHAIPAEELRDRIEERASAAGFRAARAILEGSGLCAACERA